MPKLRVSMGERATLTRTPASLIQCAELRLEEFPFHHRRNSNKANSKSLLSEKDYYLGEKDERDGEATQRYAQGLSRRQIQCSSGTEVWCKKASVELEYDEGRPFGGWEGFKR
ncbi:hypothetical protein L484_018267 [Morus notabilis]|uniref:Uncharacterized protein n=1 Tax=Morus notabilis TaxID=981085 RepID=W9SD71_9ROSA|nr:hypothetical protein L484_018267 [Morus notabilis]